MKRDDNTLSMLNRPVAFDRRFRKLEKIAVVSNTNLSAK